MKVGINFCSNEECQVRIFADEKVYMIEGKIYCKDCGCKKVKLLDKTYNFWDNEEDDVYDN